jgi:hypothetical protein
MAHMKTPFSMVVHPQQQTFTSQQHISGFSIGKQQNLDYMKTH